MSSISSSVKNFLEKISDVNIPITENKTLNLIDDLKTTPRTGKSVRIERFNLNLPKRSIYDHIASLGYQADKYLEITNLTVNNDAVAKIIVFHDLAESIIGDVPDFTEKMLAGKLHRDPKSKDVIEKRANKLIEKSLPDDLKVSFMETIKNYKENSSKETRFFNMVDKTDPIIAIWRYLFAFREQINFSSFKNAMKDFFNNPKVEDYCIDKKIKSMVKFLQNTDNTKSYHQKGSQYFQSIRKKWMSKYLKLLIETRGMHFVYKSSS